MVTSKRKAVVRLGTVLTAAALALPLLTAVTTSTASAAKAPNAISFPRNETLYTSGTAYSPPSNFNPLNPGPYTGTVGLLYEPLFLYDPIHGKYIPWLATSGSWTSATTYVIQVRNGVKWTDGTPLTGADVAYSINLAKTNPNVGYANLPGLGLVGAAASGNTVTVTFTSPPPYSSWQDYLWRNAIVPEHVWSKLSVTDQVNGANETGTVSSGPMTLVPGGVTSTEACYQDNPNWWAISALHLSFKFKYLCDQVNGSNNVELSDLLTNGIDWSNNFLPGISNLVSGLNGVGGYNVVTYYKSAPYMLSANTAWLEMNDSKAPFNNLNFRKAVAAAVNPASIVNGVYTGIVAAANPTGLLPNLDSFVNNSVVKQYGFSYNVAKAKAYLKASGYSGQKLTIEVPDGWTDWMAAIQVIAGALNSVGINVTPIYPQDAARNIDMQKGNYDFLIDNNAGADSTPWTYFDRVYQLPIGAEQNSFLNPERYTDQASWKLVQEAATTNPADTSTLAGIYSQLEKNFLQELPMIPLWYNGAWFQGNTTYWTNYPSATNTGDQNVPVMWGGYLGAETTVFALAALEPAK